MAAPGINLYILKCLTCSFLPTLASVCLADRALFTQDDLLSSLPCHSIKLTMLHMLRSGEAMSHGLLQKAMVSELFLVVALTMALTPLLAEIGARLGKAFEKSDVKVRPCLHIFHQPSFLFAMHRP